MDWIRTLLSRCAALVSGNKRDLDLDEELGAHIDLATAENLRNGMNAEQARTEALRAFGGMTQAREAYRVQRGLPFFEVLASDLRLAFRQLRKAPGFTLTVILIVALGVGANTSIFNLVYVVLLKSLPVNKPEQLYRIGDNDKCCVWTGTMDDWSIYSYPLYRYLRDHTPAFEEMAAFSTMNPALNVRRSETGATPSPLTSEFVSGNYFSMFGLHSFSGRLLTAADDRPGAAPAVVMSYRAWRDFFGDNTSGLGTVIVNGSPFTVVGVTPPGFFGDRLTNNPPDLWIPLNQEPTLRPLDSYLRLQDTHWLFMMGRAGRGFELDKIQAQLTLEIQQWLRADTSLSASDRAAIPKQRVRLGPGGAGIAALRDYFRRGLYLLAAISGMVLLVACANLASLLLVREASRRQQTLIQVALGAPRKRVLRSILTESVVLSLLGGAAGLLLAYLGTRGILVLAFGDAKNFPITTAPSLPLIGFALAVSVGTGILFGIVPAWLTSRSDPADALRGSHRATRGRASLSQESLIILQTTLSLVLLTVGGLLTHSLNTLEGQPLGFETDHRINVYVYPQTSGYEPARLSALYRELEDRLRQIPGVLHVGLSSYGPQQGGSWNSGVSFEDRSADASEHKLTTWLRVNHDYFNTLGVPLVRGRLFGDQDTPTSRRVVVVDEAFARRFFPGRDPIGQHFGMGGIAGHAADYEIIGIVRDALYNSADTVQNPVFFLPLNQSIHFDLPSYQRTEVASLYIGSIILHLAGQDTNLEANVRRAIASIDPDLMVFRIVDMKDQIALQFRQQRLIARLTSLFSLLALALASVGLYGLTAYTVAGRREEIGVRMALGADRASVVSMVLKRAMTQTAIGLALGVPLALIGGRLIASQLYKTSSCDPLVLLSATLLLAVSTVTAGFIPARRAASVDPMQALRTE